MRQKRKIVLVVIAMMMVLTLSACGGKGDVKTFVKKMQKVENLDLIGIRILEDYHFENDVIKLEKELEETKEQGKQLEQDLQLLKGYRKSEQQNLKAWADYAERLEQHRFYLMIALTTVSIAFLVALAFAVF